MNTPQSSHPLGLAVVALVAVVAASANAAPLRYLDQPAGPRSLPGDNLPPFGMLDDQGRLPPDPPAPPGAPHAGGLRESDAPGPSLDVAIAGARAAIAECRRLGFYGAATVIDSAGNARAELSADGADGSHVFVAHRKAITALAFKMPGIQVKALANKADPKILAAIKPNMFVQFGSYPITQNGQVIGAIGYSGGSDEACALAGLKVIEARLSS